MKERGGRRKVDGEKSYPDQRKSQEASILKELIVHVFTILLGNQVITTPGDSKTEINGDCKGTTKELRMVTLLFLPSHFKKGNI